jgi:hypothetical protein
VRVDPADVHELRAAGLTWRRIAGILLVSVGTARRAAGLSVLRDKVKIAPTPRQSSGEGIL